MLLLRRFPTTTADLLDGLPGNRARRQSSSWKPNMMTWMKRYRMRPFWRTFLLHPYQDSLERVARLVRNDSPRTLICITSARIHRYTRPMSPRMQSDHTAGPPALPRTQGLGCRIVRQPLRSRPTLSEDHNGQNRGLTISTKRHVNYLRSWKNTPTRDDPEMRSFVLLLVAHQTALLGLVYREPGLHPVQSTCLPCKRATS